MAEIETDKNSLPKSPTQLEKVGLSFSSLFSLARACVLGDRAPLKVSSHLVYSKSIFNYGFSKAAGPMLKTKEKTSGKMCSRLILKIVGNKERQLTSTEP